MSIAYREGMSFDANKDWRVTIDFTRASVNRADSCSAIDERPLSIHAQSSAASFGIDLEAAQLVSAAGGLGTSTPDVPLDDPRTSDISGELSLAEQMMLLGVSLPLPIAQRTPDDTAATPAGDSAQLVPKDSLRMSRTGLTHLIEVGLAPAGAPREELSADPRSVSIDPDTVDLPTLEPIRPAIGSPRSTIDEGLLADTSLDDGRPPLGNQAPAPPTVDEAPNSLDAPASDAESHLTIDRPAGGVSVPLNEVHTHIPHAATPSLHSPGGRPVELRTELSEVVRQVRTMVTEHETRTTIQLEPADLGRLTLELVDAPAGLRAHISAEDPAVLRFLERSVQLLETEARLQGVGNMSFSVGADVSGGLGRNDQRQSEGEASFRQNIDWDNATQAKPRSRRELDTSA